MAKKRPVAGTAASQPAGSRKLDPRFEKFINHYPTAAKWLSQYDIDGAVEANGGLVRIENFFPDFVADGCLQVLSSISPAEWKETAALEDYRHNNISHRFDSTKHAKGLESITRLFTLLRPDSLHAFSAARYCKSDHIAPHDDRAYTQVKLDTGRVITTSRTLAVIYYLTKDWRPEYGGALLDLEDGGRPYVPLYNSVVAFRVPRYHQVTALTTDRPRYSIFGWFLEPGKLYDLYRGEAQEQHDARWRQQQEQEQHKQDLQPAGAVTVAAEGARKGVKRKAAEPEQHEEQVQLEGQQQQNGAGKRRRGSEHGPGEEPEDGGSGRRGVGGAGPAPEARPHGAPSGARVRGGPGVQQAHGVHVGTSSRAGVAGGAKARRRGAQGGSGGPRLPHYWQGRRQHGLAALHACDPHWGPMDLAA